MLDDGTTSHLKCVLFETVGLDGMRETEAVSDAKTMAETATRGRSERSYHSEWLKVSE